MTKQQINLMLAIDYNLKLLEELLPKSKVARDTTKLFIKLMQTLNEVKA